MSDTPETPAEPVELRTSVETTHAVIYVTAADGSKYIMPGQTITEEVDTTPPPGGQLPEGALPPVGSNPPRVDNALPGPVPDNALPGPQPEIDNTLPPEGTPASRSPRRP